MHVSFAYLLLACLVISILGKNDLQRKVVTTQLEADSPEVCLGIHTYNVAMNFGVNISGLFSTVTASIMIRMRYTTTSPTPNVFRTLSFTPLGDQV